MSIGILTPGAMGASIGAALRQKDETVAWVEAGRSAETRRRADAAELHPVASVDELVTDCDTIISVCPPAAAYDVADTVAGAGFRGCYLDANAVAPTTARRIAARVRAGGARFVDGGIVGPPVAHRGLTVLYLAGDPADVAAIRGHFDGTALDTHVAGPDPGAASAVKMAFAAWTKGTSALVLAIRALAEAEGVVEPLAHAWSVLTPDLIERTPNTARTTAPKAWRFVGEMEEIAATFEQAGLPGGFHHAAAEIYAALTDLRDADDPTIDDVVDRLTER